MRHTGRAEGRHDGIAQALQAMAAALLFMLLVMPAQAAGISEMSDEELGGVVAMKGVGLLLELRMNTDAAGAPLASLSACAGLNNPCKLGISFADRLGGGGEWIMLKDFYGRLFVDGLNVDGSFNPAAYTSYYDATRFQNDAGTCLLAGCDPRNLPALQLSFTGSPAVFENDVTIGLEIGRVSIEYGASAYAATDVNGSFLGLRIRDTAGTAASIDIDGKFRVYGF